MVRELKLEGCIEYMESQAVFSFLFGDEQFTKRYHKEQNDDPDAEVSSWTVDGSRVVKFAAPLNAPNVIKRFIGVDTICVTEVQTYSRVGNTFTVKSDPKVDHPRGFTTRAEMTLGIADSGKGCLVSITAILECNAAVWGVQGTIESFMESKARKSFLGWMKLARQYCKEQVTIATGLQYVGQDEELPAVDSSDDEFFDLSEEDEKALDLSSENRSLGVIYSQEGEVGLQNWLMHSVTRQLNHLHITCDASRSHVEELNRRLQTMEENFSIFQSQLQECYSVPRGYPWGLFTVGLATGVLLTAGHMFWRSHRFR